MDLPREPKKSRSRSSSSHKFSKRKGSSRLPELNCVDTISDILSDHMFSGWICERKWVDNLLAYRDVIEVDEHETHLNEHLKILVNEIEGVQTGSSWINITGPNVSTPCYCLWILLDEPPTPGHYWFYIKDVTSDETFGLRIAVKIIRSLHEGDFESVSKRKSRLNKNSVTDEWNELLNNVSSIDFNEVQSHICEVVKPSNMMNFFRFFIALSATIIWSFVSFFQHGIPTCIKFIDAFGIFIMRITPAFQILLQFFEKIIGGILVLISFIFRDFRQPPPPPTRPMKRPQARYLTYEE